MNITFAKKVLEYAENEPRGFEFNMSWWFSPGLGRHSPDDDNLCGTSACLAGTAVWLHPEMKINFGDIISAPVPRVMDRGEPSNWEKAGARALGITRVEADTLFYRSNRDAIARLRRLIELAEARNERRNARRRARYAEKKAAALAPKPIKVEYLPREESIPVPVKELVNA